MKNTLGDRYNLSTSPLHGVTSVRSISLEPIPEPHFSSGMFQDCVKMIMDVVL